MGSPVVVEPVLDRKAMATFIALPQRIQGGDPRFVPPLLLERAEALGRKNPIHGHAEVRYWLARRDGRAVGRISAQHNRLHQETHNDSTGHFGLIEGEDDGAVFAALTGAAEAWLRHRGLARVVGPFSLSVNEESGLLVAGFDTPPAMMMGHAPAYYGARLAEQGYGKVRDLFAYRFDVARALPDAVQRMAARAAGDRIVVRPLNRRRYHDEVARALAIYNEAWAANWSALPMTAAEQRHMASSMRPLVDPELVWFVELDGAMIAFVVCLPNLNEAIADLGGRLLPFGWAKLLWRLKVRGLGAGRVPLMGVRKDLQGTPLGAAAAVLVIDAMRKVATAKGYRQVELSWVLEDNLPIQRLIGAFGAEPYKTYRLYEKSLV